MNQINTSRTPHNFSLFTFSFSLIIMFTLVVSADFSRDGDIVVDSVTKLEWQDDAIVDSMEWKETISHCEDDVSLGGYDNWRLPNINELKTIIDRSRYNPATVSIFEHTSSYYYWSSTTYEGNHEFAWSVYSVDGNISNSNKDCEYSVRCVRDGD